MLFLFSLFRNSCLKLFFVEIENTLILLLLNELIYINAQYIHVTYNMNYSLVVILILCTSLYYPQLLNTSIISFTCTCICIHDCEGP